MGDTTSHRAGPRRYPRELRDRAVRLVLETMAEQGTRYGAVKKVGDQLGVNPDTLREWVQQAEIDQGARAGLSSAERERLRELERENRELRRANEILKAASTFFAAELDRHSGS